MSISSPQIPSWYSDDWEPARGLGELPQMTWDAVETALDSLPMSAPLRETAKTSFRTLWQESALLDPMSLLQRFLVTAAQVLSTNRMRTSQISMPTGSPTERMTGNLPRWSFTDVEVALDYTWSGTALMVAIERHHDLLEIRGQRCSAETTVRQLLLLVSGLPSPAPTRRSPDLSDARDACQTGL